MRAILRPATLVELGVFRFAFELEGGVAGAVLDDGTLVLSVLVGSAELLGFMWMIFRGRVGGGGRVISSLFSFLLLPEDVRLSRGLVFSALYVGEVGVAGL